LETAICKKEKREKISMQKETAAFFTEIAVSF